MDRRHGSPPTVAVSGSCRFSGQSFRQRERSRCRQGLRAAWFSSDTSTLLKRVGVCHLSESFARPLSCCMAKRMASTSPALHSDAASQQVNRHWHKKMIQKGQALALQMPVASQQPTRARCNWMSQKYRFRPEPCSRCRSANVRYTALPSFQQKRHILIKTKTCCSL